MRGLLAPIALLLLGACADDPDPPSDAGGSTAAPPGFVATAPNGTGTTPKTTKPALEVLTEAVYILFEDYDGGSWMCTGSLVSKDVVVTAGHCLDDNRFYRWQVVAPLLPGKPRVETAAAYLQSYDHGSPSEPDIGFLVLEESIEAPNYAELTDVSERIEKGEELEAVTIVRSAEEAEAPFKSVDKLKLHSTTEMGYAHGYGTKMFSAGGDSGAGYYLVENGQATHKLIAVAREPDPDSGLDHMTRIDSDFMNWFSSTR